MGGSLDRTIDFSVNLQDQDVLEIALICALVVLVLFFSSQEGFLLFLLFYFIPKLEPRFSDFFSTSYEIANRNGIEIFAW